jgi:hypothetical protein
LQIVVAALLDFKEFTNFVIHFVANIGVNCKRLFLANFQKTALPKPASGGHRLLH